MKLVSIAEPQPNLHLWKGVTYQPGLTASSEGNEEKRPEKPDKRSLILWILICIRTFATEKADSMEVIFNEIYLRDLYTEAKSDKKHRFQPQIIRKYIRIVDLMKSEKNVLGLMKYHSLRYEKTSRRQTGFVFR